jgi:3D (Asp-Asp-Asp) domain-containing protein
MRFCAAVLLAALLTAGIAVPAQAFSGTVFMLVDGPGAMNIFSFPHETVGELLARSERELRELDVISVDLDYRPANGDVIRITRKEYATQTDMTVIPFRTVHVHAAEVKAGETTVLQAGVNGSGERTWRRFIVNGVVMEEELIGERVITPPVDERIGMGFRSVPISPFDFEFEFCENHEPIGYTQVIRGMRSAGYWAPAGALTSTGRVAESGLVAVNPRVIPYGSRLFIQAASGRLIYGYAIAADTGPDIMRGVIDIDLFYPVWQDAWDHGIWFVDVFILP